MTSTQVKYKSTGGSDLAKQPLGYYGPNKAHDGDREPTPAVSAYERGRLKPFKLLQTGSLVQQQQGSTRQNALRAKLRKMIPEGMQMAAPGARNYVAQRTMETAQAIAQ